jgi:hypothetical protein
MLINYFKKYSSYVSSLFIIFTFFGLASITNGAELKYVTIVESKNDQVLFKTRSLEKTNYSLCETTNLACQDLGSTTPDKTLEALAEDEPQSTKIRYIDFNRKNASRILLSPDEKWLTYYNPALTGKSEGKKERQFVLLKLKGNQIIGTSKLSGAVDYWDLLSEELRIYNFSPSGNKLMYLDDRNGYSVPYLVDLTKDKTNYLPGQQIITKKYSVADFMFWSDDVIYFSANRESSHQWSLYRYNLITKDLQKVADNISYNQQMVKVGTGTNAKLLFTQLINNSAIPVLLDPTISKLSYFPTLSANPKVSGYTEEEIKLGELNGVLLKPSNYSASQKYPLIVWLHGGPYRQTALGYHSYFSYGGYDWLLGEIAKSGVLVLKLDYRGSYGYGRDFAESITGEVGRGDVTDVLSAQAELKKTYKVANTYLTGNSYGGYLALRTIVDSSARGQMAGALSINGVTDWFVLLDKLENSIFNVQFNGLLTEENSDLYYQANISDHIKNLRGQKIIVAQAEKDGTVPASQADYIAKIFSLKEKALTLVKYKDEDHIFQKKSSLEDLCRQLASLTNTQTDCQWK